jgi:hypothetical protein
MKCKDYRTDPFLYRVCFWFAETLFVAPIVTGVAASWILDTFSDVKYPWVGNVLGVLTLPEKYPWVGHVLGVSWLAGLGLLCLMSALCSLRGYRKYSNICVLTIIVAIVLALLFPSTGSHWKRTVSSQHSTF